MCMMEYTDLKSFNNKCLIRVSTFRLMTTSRRCSPCSAPLLFVVQVELTSKPVQEKENATEHKFSKERLYKRNGTVENERITDLMRNQVVKVLFF